MFPLLDASGCSPTISITECYILNEGVKQSIMTSATGWNRMTSVMFSGPFVAMLERNKSWIRKPSLVRHHQRDRTVCIGLLF